MNHSHTSRRIITVLCTIVLALALLVTQIALLGGASASVTSLLARGVQAAHGALARATSDPVRRTSAWMVTVGRETSSDPCQSFHVLLPAVNGAS